REVRNLYIAGHYFQAAVMHYRATGERTLLEQACAWAERLEADFRSGHEAFADLKVQNHPCIEVGLMLLARAAGRDDLRAFARDIMDAYHISERVADLECGRSAR